MTSGEAAVAGTEETSLLEEFGYKQELKRDLRFWTAWAIGFAFVSPIVGLYTIVGLGVTTAGPAWIWAIPFVAVGQLTLAFVYAQLAAKWPIAGGIYQWSRRLIGPKYGWWAGWIYMWALVLIVAGVTYAGGGFFGDLIGVSHTSHLSGVLLGLVLLVAITLTNAVGLRLLKYAILIGIGAEIVGSVAVAVSLLLVARNQPASVLVDTSATPDGTAFLPAFIAVVAFAGWAFLGFDACGSVAEETRNPRKAVPRAIVLALIPVVVVEILGSIALMLATPDMKALVSGAVADPVSNAVGSGLGHWAEKPFLVVVVIGFLACALAVQATAVRVLYSFSRDSMVPGSSVWSRVWSRNGIPVNSVLLVAALAALAFLYANALDVLVTFSTGAYFVGFLCPVAGLLYVRLRRRWTPYPEGPYRGWFGFAVTIVAFVWALAEGINIAWPRESGGPWYQTWAVLLGLGAFGIVGLVYFLWSRPDRRLTLDSAALGGTPSVDAASADETRGGVTASVAE